MAVSAELAHPLQRMTGTLGQGVEPYGKPRRVQIHPYSCFDGTVSGPDAQTLQRRKVAQASLSTVKHSARVLATLA